MLCSFFFLEERFFWSWCEGGAVPVVYEFAVKLLLSACGRENFARGEHLTCFLQWSRICNVS